MFDLPIRLLHMESLTLPRAFGWLWPRHAVYERVVKMHPEKLVRRPLSHRPQALLCARARPCSPHVSPLQEDRKDIKVLGEQLGAAIHIGARAVRPSAGQEVVV